jgi:hypothetical protein
VVADTRGQLVGVLGRKAGVEEEAHDGGRVLDLCVSVGKLCPR